MVELSPTRGLLPNLRLPEHRSFQDHMSLRGVVSNRPVKQLDKS